jgi:uncharacterized protein (DUF305 family)
MTPMMRSMIQRAALSGAGLLLLVAGAVGATSAAPIEQAATPAAYSCANATAIAGTPTMAHGAMTMTPMPMASPMAAMGTEFDQMYIDMMLPHHASIIALAQAAEGRLTDPRLQQIARNIIQTQSVEIDKLRRYRQRFYGSAEPPMMNHPDMAAMLQAMPGMGTMDEMAKEMDAAAQVAAFCAASDPNLAFIDLTIPHHQMAVAASKAALAKATHPEIGTFAQGVIGAQQREIDELQAIRADLTGATPEATP